jgi:hypothetical protein
MPSGLSTTSTCTTDCKRTEVRAPFPKGGNWRSNKVQMIGFLTDDMSSAFVVTSTVGSKSSVVDESNYSVYFYPKTFCWL